MKTDFEMVMVFCTFVLRVFFIKWFYEHVQIKINFWEWRAGESPQFVHLFGVLATTAPYVLLFNSFTMRVPKNEKDPRGTDQLISISELIQLQSLVDEFLSDTGFEHIEKQMQELRYLAISNPEMDESQGRERANLMCFESDIINFFRRLQTFEQSIIKAKEVRS